MRNKQMMMQGFGGVAAGEMDGCEDGEEERVDWETVYIPESRCIAYLALGTFFLFDLFHFFVDCYVNYLFDRTEIPGWKFVHGIHCFVLFWAVTEILYEHNI